MVCWPVEAQPDGSGQRSSGAPIRTLLAAAFASTLVDDSSPISSSIFTIPPIAAAPSISPLSTLPPRSTLPVPAQPAIKRRAAAQPGATTAKRILAAGAPVAATSPSSVPAAPASKWAASAGAAPAAASTLASAVSVRLETSFRTYLAGRPGHVSVAFQDAVTGTSVAVTDPAVAGYEMASTAKLNILAALVLQAGSSGQLSARQQALAHKMISVSDNASAVALWKDVGGEAGMNVFYARLAMTSTKAGSGRYWGLTSTTAPDQLAVLRAISYPGVLTAQQREVIRALLQTVVASQRWGLTGGVPSDVAVDLKNGWLPRSTGGWVITSLAHVHGGGGRDYVMAVYTKNGPSMASGVATVEGLSTIAWQAAQAAQAAVPGTAG